MSLLTWTAGLVLALAPGQVLAQDLAPPVDPEVGLEAALEALADSSRPVAERAAAAGALAAPDAGRSLAERRASALAERARRDPSGVLRAAALEALALVEGPVASAALVELVVDLPEPEATRAAALLRARSAAGRELLDLLHSTLAEDPLPGGRLAELVGGLGRAFADRGRAADHILFTQARLHGDAAVRSAAAAALEVALVRLASQRADERALALLDDLAGAPWPAAQLLVRRATYQLSSGRGVEAVPGLMAEVERLTRGRRDHEGRRLRFLASYLEASALLGLGRPEEVLVPLTRASLCLDGLATERQDLAPWPEAPSTVAARRQTDVLELRGLVELLAATAGLAAGASPADAVVLGHLARAHEFGLWAQLREAAVDDRTGVSGIDVLLDAALGPRRLVLSAPDSPVWSGTGRADALDLLLDLGSAAAAVLGDELPGFRPPASLTAREGGPEAWSLRQDPRRFGLLKLLRPAQALAIQRRLDATWDQAEMRLLDLRARAVQQAIERDIEDGWSDLSDLRLPSIFALLLAGDLRAEDRAEQAVELCARLHADLSTGDTYDQGAWGAWLAARVEIAHGGALGDAGRPREALVVLESAAGRLEAVENTLEERKRQDADPRSSQVYDQQLIQTRSLRAQALVAMAVNSNVRLGDPATALAYFERAYLLDQSDFMRGLLACYRARFGATEEARALLRTVRPAPDVYYNLACAHALLGDLDEALAMLRRELEENHPTPGSLARQQRWAREDPDLANLWDDPRFQELTE